MKYAIYETIIVEGKYDLHKVKSVFSSPVLTTRGFGIFRDDQLISYLRRLASHTGILILTDPDASGNKIRNVIKSRVQGRVLNAYIPDLYGKEKRKKTSSAEGKLGVEAMDTDTILNAVRRSGARFIGEDYAVSFKEPITRSDLFEVGLLGKEDSNQLRLKFLSLLSLPERMNVSSMLEAINLILTRDDFFTMILSILP